MDSTMQKQFTAEYNTLCSSLPLHHVTPSVHHQYQQPHAYQSEPQPLSEDEWDLIQSFRMMKTLNSLSSFQSSSFPSNQYTTDTSLYQTISSFSQTGHQKQALVHFTTESTTTTPSCQLPTSEEISRQSSFHKEIQLCNCESTSTFKTVIRSPLPSPSPSTASGRSTPSPTTINLSSPQSPIRKDYGQTISTSQTESGHQNYSYIHHSQSQSDHQNHSFIQHSQSGHQNHSPIQHSRSHSPLVSSPVGIVSPVQQQQTSTNQRSSSPSQQRQSCNLQISSTHEYKSLITTPTVELLDSTKPYQAGDTIKVGGRLLKTDVLSMKYWMNDDITITETTNGGQILNMAGYSYVVKNHGKYFTKWECENRRNRLCSSIHIRTSDPRITNSFTIYSIQGSHIHEPTPNNVKLYRIRQNHLPKSPITSDFVLHQGFTLTDQGARFLLYDSNTVEVPYAPAPASVGRLIIYSSDLQLQILSRSKRVASDGTFQTAANISQQNYIIVGEYEDHHTVPVLPRTRLIGCAFHYAQCVHRNIQSHGLQNAYQNNKLIRQILRQTMALAYMPSDQIRKLYYDVIQVQQNTVVKDFRKNLRSFFKYFESFWLKKIHQFCVFGESIRTNNGLEGMH
ncbi:unnamed protein product [Adineta steineri]|uniref:FLYWCH-type domain-containing protein n=1 Tax=Adineta steineri TaxID=433720 RepID=A0A815MTL0_9BILA|nr:unnamed protein product [Adineta steineri]CAF4034623.1 unnamed protein product [Adineta steineri]